MAEQSMDAKVACNRLHDTQHGFPDAVCVLLQQLQQHSASICTIRPLHILIRMKCFAAPAIFLQAVLPDFIAINLRACAEHVFPVHLIAAVPEFDAQLSKMESLPEGQSRGQLAEEKVAHT